MLLFFGGLLFQFGHDKTAAKPVAAPKAEEYAVMIVIHSAVLLFFEFLCIIARKNALVKGFMKKTQKIIHFVSRDAAYTSPPKASAATTAGRSFNSILYTASLSRSGKATHSHETTAFPHSAPAPPTAAK